MRILARYATSERVEEANVAGSATQKTDTAESCSLYLSILLNGDFFKNEVYL